MKNFKKRDIALTSLVLFAFIASYFVFSSYKPKVIKQIEVVKGVQTENTDSLPLPDGAEKVGVNRSNESTQTTFHTSKPKSEVQDFYKNIFYAKKWTLESQGVYPDFVILRYKKENELVSVITFDTQEENKTLVSIETKKL